MLFPRSRRPGSPGQWVETAAMAMVSTHAFRVQGVVEDSGEGRVAAVCPR